MIDTGRGVLLGPIKGDHLAALFDWRNDPKIFRWTRQNDLITWAHHFNWWSQAFENPTLKMYGVFARNHGGTQQLIGVAGLTTIDMTNRRAELSLYIEPGWQRNGYGEKALSTLFDHAFKNLGLNCVWGEPFEESPAIKLFTKLKMKHEGTRRQFYYREGKLQDAHIYSILADEWLMKKAVSEAPITFDVYQHGPGAINLA